MHSLSIRWDDGLCPTACVCRQTTTVKDQEEASHRPPQAKGSYRDDHDKHIGREQGQRFHRRVELGRYDYPRKNHRTNIDYQRQEEPPEKALAARGKLTALLPTPGGTIRPYNPKDRD